LRSAPESFRLKTKSSKLLETFYLDNFLRD
jgi:hypothetical protein